MKVDSCRRSRASVGRLRDPVDFMLTCYVCSVPEGYGNGMAGYSSPQHLQGGLYGAVGVGAPHAGGTPSGQGYPISPHHPGSGAPTRMLQHPGASLSPVPGGAPGQLHPATGMPPPPGAYPPTPGQAHLHYPHPDRSVPAHDRGTSCAGDDKHRFFIIIISTRLSFIYFIDSLFQLSNFSWVSCVYFN